MDWRESLGQGADSEDYEDKRETLAFVACGVIVAVNLGIVCVALVMAWMAPSPGTTGRAVAAHMDIVDQATADLSSLQESAPFDSTSQDKDRMARDMDSMDGTVAAAPP